MFVFRSVLYRGGRCSRTGSDEGGQTFPGDSQHVAALPTVPGGPWWGGHPLPAAVSRPDFKLRVTFNSLSNMLVSSVKLMLSNI